MLNLDFKMEIVMRISSMITRLNSRLSYSSMGKANDHEYMMILINKVNSKTLIFFLYLIVYTISLLLIISFSFFSFFDGLLIISLLRLIAFLVYLILK